MYRAVDLSIDGVGHCQDPIDIPGIHIAVRDKSDDSRDDLRRPHPRRFELIDEAVGRPRKPGLADDHHVRDHCGGVDCLGIALR